MEIAKIQVSATTGRCLSIRRIPAKLVGGTVSVEFADSIWDRLSKTVVFRCGESRIAEFDGTTAIIPWEILEEPGKRLYFGIWGNAPDAELQIPLIEVPIGVVETATDPDADPGTDPTLPVWAELKNRVEQLEQNGTGGPGTPGQDGEDGGYYTPEVSQVDENTMKVSFTASKDGMAAVEDQKITLPSGKNGADGKTPVKGTDYFTEAERNEIAEAAAAMVTIPDSGGNAVQYIPQELTEEQKAQARANIGAYGNLESKSYNYTEPGYINYSTGAVVENNYALRNTGFIPLNNVKRVVGNAYADINVAELAFFDKDKNFIQGISVAGTGRPVNYDIDLSDSKYTNAMYVMFTGYGPTDFSRFSCTVYYRTAADYEEYIATLNPLYKKIVSFNGDSICAINGGYGKIIAQKNGMEYENIAVSEATITAGTYKADETTPQHWICRTVSNMREDADYAIVEGGINDAANYKVPLGEITEFGTWEFDDTTFYGAFESMLRQLLVRFSGKKVGYVAAHMMRGDMSAESPYYEAAKKCCEKWRVPICDLNLIVPPFHKFGSDAPDDLLALRTTYTLNGDGWHPTEEGYTKYYCDKIEAWMKTL